MGRKVQENAFFKKKMICIFLWERQIQFPKSEEQKALLSADSFLKWL